MDVRGLGDIFGIAARWLRRRGEPCHSSCATRTPIFPALLLFLLFLNATLFTTVASAQQGKPGVVGLGDLVVTGFSGTLPPPPNPPLPPGVNELDETFIDPNGASLKIFDVTNPGGPPAGQLLNAPEKFQVFARDIGQVFGLALDKSDPANIFAASTSVHGLQIVVPDADGDGRPERIRVGQPGAQWMDGQFGEARGGGPGTVWKINGETGEITKFADILSNGLPNSGPGLGNVAFDPKHKQLFVSDLDTGLIHRLDMTGADLGIFDHGLQGRPANGLNAVPDDGARTGIANPAFDAEDSSSWGLAPPGRRVWGLAVRGNRLYYSVEEGPQIWSVGINQDGSFGDPRWELDVPADPKAYPVSDIAFQSNGLMLLAQRGGIASRYDYSQYQAPRKSRVLRFQLESPDDPATPSRWNAVPDDYAIGFPGIHRNTSGGIAIGYGYKKKADGSYGRGSCEGTLWSTGDALRDNPVHGARLAQGGPLNVHGLQGNALSLVRPQNVPPWATYFVDYDGQFDDPQASGHVGDVEIPRRCKRQHADLRIWKKTRPERCTAGNQCIFEVEIENVGSLPYSGPLVVRDIAEGGARLVSHQPPPPGWDCQEHFSGSYECTHPPVTLGPGEKTVLELTFQLPPWWDRYIYKNCIELLTPGFDKDPRRYNNRSCDYVPTVTPGHEHYKPDLQLEKYAVFGNCDLAGICLYVVRIINVGAAPYTGVLSIHDTIAQPGSSLIDWGPQPQWTCAAGGVAGSYDCTLLAPVTLSPGEFRELTLFVQGPPLASGHTYVRNCSSIVWQGPQDINPFNEHDCAEVSLFPFGHPDARPKLKVAKDGPAICEKGAGPGGGWLCKYTVTITNSGGAPYLDPLVVTDTTKSWLPGGVSTLAEYQNSPPWTCLPGTGSPGTQTCTRLPVPGGLQPGESRLLDVAVEWPAAIAANIVHNCASISHDNDGDGVAEDIEACAATFICTPGPGGNCPDDLAIRKTVQAGPCWPGFPCNFEIELENRGSNVYPAGLVITDVPNPDAGALTVLSPGPAIVSCAPAGPNHSCTVHWALFAGFTGKIRMQFDVPPAYPWTTLKNCASIPSGVPGNSWDFNDEECAMAFIPGPDLAPHSDTECELGASCKLPASIDNNGQREFKGAAGVLGVLSPDLQITAIVSKTPGFTCAKTGYAAYECKGSNLSIKPGSAVEYELTVNVPANYPHARVNHTKDMVWPDRKVKDKNPENDQHTSIITIEQPKEPPPPPPAGRPDLAISKTANQGSCRAGSSCGYTLNVRSVGTAPYRGAIAITDRITPANARLAGSGPAPWNCRKTHGSVLCTHPNTTLAPGQSKSLSLNFTLPRNARGVANNCATLDPGAASRGSGSLRDVQSALSARGFNPGPADGKMGTNTRNAIRAFQSQNNQTPTGQVNPALLNALFGGAGGEDSNPANNRACASSTIIAAPPPQCTGGRFRDSAGTCVCPSSTPVWTGRVCIPRPPLPQPCFGGQFRNNNGICVCPTNKPVWTGQICIARPVGCTGGRVKTYVGGKIICTCPSNKPVWTGRSCIPRPPQQCTGGQTKQYVGGKLICRCPANKPNWIGGICLPKINICSGGRTFSLQKRKCVCPSNKPIWNSKKNKCVSRRSCSGGKVLSSNNQCVCPRHKVYWYNNKCNQYPSHGGGQTTAPGGPSEIACTGGRQFVRGKCRCPSSRPVWTGKFCAPRLQTINPQGPVLKLPGGTFKIPGIKIQ